MEKKILPYLVVISALSVSLSAAFYSVTGIGKMFSGSSVNVMIMMASLEIAKLILASLLYQYWSKLSKLLKAYYISAIFILMMITSAGIYGYLSSAYSETSTKVETIDKQVAVLDMKKKIFETQLSDIRTEKQSINGNITDLTKGLSNNVQQKIQNGKITTTTSSANRKAFEGQLSSAQKRRDDISIKEANLVDSISAIDLAKLSLETNSDVASDIGPLKYISKITNRPIDTVVNWFIIALMLVFDPLAVSLVIGANIVFKDKNREKELNDSIDEAEKKLVEYSNMEKEFEEKKKKFQVESDEIDLKRSSFDKDLNDMESKLKEEYEFKRQELESNISNREAELLVRETDLDSKILKLKEETEKLQNLEASFEKNKEIISEERNRFNKLKSSISKEKRELEEDKKEIKEKLAQIKSLQSEISEKERNIEFIKDDLTRLDDEIKEWESQHWKLKRNPPPSAILD